MNLLKKSKKYFLHPELIEHRLLCFILDSRFSDFIPDKIFLKLQFRQKLRKKLNLKNPVTFNEKVQWLKLYAQKQNYVQMADKYEVRKYIAQTIGEKYLIPLVGKGIWNNFDEINFSELPDRFILKCTHDSGGHYICSDKNIFNIDEARKKINECLERHYYYSYREYIYKNIKPRIIAEQLMSDDDVGGLKDYKIFCFNGIPKIIEIDIDRFKKHKRNFYSTDWKYHACENDAPTDPDFNIERPQSLDIMLELAKKLSFDIPLLRVDLYYINKEIYFGELTFFDGAGYNNYDPPEWDKILGDWLVLPSSKKKR